MKKQISLPIFWHTDETANLSEIGVDFKMNDCRIKEITFYNIDCICSCDGDGDNEKEIYTKVFSSGQNFICSKHIDEVRKLIDILL